MDSVQQNEKYHRIIENIDRLPSLPTIVTRLVKVVNSPDTSAEDAASLIEKDPALTGRMLRLANSAFYGIPRTISSVQSAVVILGFNTIKSLVLSSSVVKAFSGTQGEIFDRKRFWKHSIVCALAARAIVRAFMHVKIMDPESAFCAGILHDIGKLIFEQYATADYKESCEYARKNKCPLIEAEKQIMGITHSEVGRIISDKWALPIELETAIVLHHDPKTSGEMTELITTVHLANLITHQLNVGLWADEQPPREWAQARAIMRMDEAAFNRISDTVKQEIEKSDEFYAIIN
jgi:HD-like signal output (HDOD) protein